ncbi:hypothetical protein DLAC_05491 [Tieghemostelium lacteum]|uniref:ABC3 transporter permease C-terminal domain-containing protein n=1 Tax=Tieghemostelium lacteum TaxID=361077 RepID=A0A151ZGA3_TIELA|nr:hypothetical protein DLAC_05491 [Tieghemostelium lacteum]|eukprot:KYQ92900.1 hypothetical protein DLAC_05491 [Tieghemostelium lacteum]
MSKRSLLDDIMTSVELSQMNEESTNVNNNNNNNNDDNQSIITGSERSSSSSNTSQPENKKLIRNNNNNNNNNNYTKLTDIDPHRFKDSFGEDDDVDQVDYSEDSQDTYASHHTDSPFFQPVKRKLKRQNSKRSLTDFSGHLHTVRGFFQYVYMSLRYTLYSDFRVALKYVHNNMKKDKKSLLLGLFTVFLVVLFICFLQNLIQNSPIVFLKLSEDQAGELDLVLFGDPSLGPATESLDVPSGNQDPTPSLKLSVSSYKRLNFTRILSAVKATNVDAITQSLMSLDVSGYFVNSTFLNQTLANANTVHGIAPRWLSLGDMTAPSTNQTGSLIYLVINSELEKSIGLGRGWTLPPLVGNQIYMSSTFLRRLQIKPNENQQVNMHIDFIDVMERLGMTSTVPTLAELEQQIVDAIGGPIPESVDITALVKYYTILNPGSDIVATLENIFGEDSIDESFNSVIFHPKIALENLYASIRNALIIDKQLIVMSGFDEPGGKFPSTLGNVGVLESSYVEGIVREKVQNISHSLSNANTTQLQVFIEMFAPFVFPNTNVTQIFTAINQSIKKFQHFSNNFELNDYTMSPVIVLENRVKIYTASSDDQKIGLMEFTNQVSTLIGYNYPVTFTTPLADTLALFYYTQMSLGQIFTSVATVLLVLGALMIYSMLLSDVEGKTFEYGMLRAQGMRHYALIILLLTQALYFSIPGILFGLLFGWAFYAIVAYFVYVKVVLLPANLTFYTVSILSGILLGLLMPIVANIAPIQRALSKTLRDALDIYHQVKNETMVKIMKLEEIGLDVLQTIMALLAVIVGFTVYYLIPYSFIFHDFQLFFSILTAILMAMLFGLAMLAQSVQTFIEKAVLFVLVWGKDRRSLYGLIKKNLFSHSSRNSKTVTMLTISLTYIIFNGCVFKLQGHNIQELVKLGIGSDISILATSTNNPIPETQILGYLDNDMANNSNSVISGYSVVTFPLDRCMNIRQTRLLSLAQYPDYSVRVYGVQSNFLQNTYLEFYDETEINEYIKVPKIPNDPKSRPDIIESLYSNEHKVLIPEDNGVIQAPPSIVSNGSVQFDPTNPIWQWLRNHHDNQYIYKNYTDIVLSEAFRLAMGADTNTPFNLYISFKQFSTASNSVNLLAKSQSMVGMMPAFFFSTYSQTATRSPVLINMNEFYNILQFIYSITEDPTVVLPPVPPKSKVLIKLKPNTSQIDREGVINGVKSFIKTDNIQVMDTQHLLDTTDTAATILNIFFYTVSTAAIILCFFMLWVSFSANIHENSWEFGVLRSIGLTAYQVVRVYAYEALVLIFTSMFLGLLIGLGVALTLTLQFDLFTELPFSFQFPYYWFFGVLVASIAIAIIGSIQASKEYRYRQIASVLKGK